jgi:FMR1-interacting protein 1 (NUFIP1)/Zinc finger C-x8-C-x5-C-x3-H type (and similar)
MNFLDVLNFADEQKEIEEQQAEEEELKELIDDNNDNDVDGSATLLAKLESLHQDQVDGPLVIHPRLLEATHIGERPEDIERWIDARRKRYPTERKRTIAAAALDAESDELKAKRRQRLAENGDRSRQKRKPRCRYFAGSGHCQKGDACPFSHEKVGDGGGARGPTAASRDDVALEQNKLLEQLLRDVITHEHHAILQCFEYLRSKRANDDDNGDGNDDNGTDIGDSVAGATTSITT